MYIVLPHIQFIMYLSPFLYREFPKGRDCVLFMYVCMYVCIYLFIYGYLVLSTESGIYR